MAGPEDAHDPDATEARVVVLGTDIAGGDTLFAGGLGEAREFVAGLSAEERASVAIVTDGRVYGPEEL